MGTFYSYNPYIDNYENYLAHFGIKKKSGRYPWGSGERPYQHGPKALKKLGNKFDVSNARSISESIKRADEVQACTESVSYDKAYDEATYKLKNGGNVSVPLNVKNMDLNEMNAINDAAYNCITKYDKINKDLTEEIAKQLYDGPYFKERNSDTKYENMSRNDFKKFMEGHMSGINIISDKIAEVWYMGLAKDNDMDMFGDQSVIVDINPINLELINKPYLAG